MADIFDKVAGFLRESPIVGGKDRAIAESVLYRQSPLDNAGPWMEVEGRRVLQFSTNDYLGLARHPRLRQAATEIVSKYGVSSPMGARPLTGTTGLHAELERELAAFKRTEAALVFSNGAQAMMGCVAALAGAKDLIVLDQYAHASLVCGARISGARTRFFQHNDMNDLEAVLAKAPPEQAKMVVVDGVYSMQGDMAPLDLVCDLCRQYGARLLVDDAHGTGVCGANGRGTAELFGVEDRVDLHLGTCSKALATVGGFAAGDADVLEFLQFNAPTILFTKAMPSCVAAATLEALKLVRDGNDRRKALWENARRLQDGLNQAGFNIGQTCSPITPIQGNGTDAIHMCTALYRAHAIWVSAVLYPAVALGTSILRAIPTAAHTGQDVETLLSSIVAVKNGCQAAPGAEG
ncbi:MAG: pyridoxal phosphate-dependent aminotransferase family protein [Planctomycetota bacterium]|nr:pyridoxal phosphate-dependent aminotransferase family protein [Planctomycetota bacterium]